jgi:DNA primase large subunit
MSWFNFWKEDVKITKLENELVFVNKFYEELQLANKALLLKNEQDHVALGQVRIKHEQLLEQLKTEIDKNNKLSAAIIEQKDQFNDVIRQLDEDKKWLMAKVVAEEELYKSKLTVELDRINGEHQLELARVKIEFKDALVNAKVNEAEKYLAKVNALVYDNNKPLIKEDTIENNTRFISL